MDRSEAIVSKEFKKFLTRERNGRAFLYTDTRTKIINGVHHIFPIGIDQNQVYIVCPYCREFHQHGTADGDYEGGLTPHCIDSVNKKNYYIEKI